MAFAHSGVTESVDSVQLFALGEQQNRFGCLGSQTRDEGQHPRKPSVPVEPQSVSRPRKHSDLRLIAKPGSMSDTITMVFQRDVKYKRD